MCSGSESKYNVFGSIQHWYKYENRLVTIIFPIHQEASVIYSIMCNLDNTESKVYGGDPRGMHATWNALEDQLRSLHNNTTTPLPSPDTYTLPFPASLSGPLTVKNLNFETRYACPAMLKPVSCKAKTTLVRHLAAELNSSLAAGINLTGISEKIDSGCEAEAKGDTQPPPPCNLRFLVPVT